LLPTYRPVTAENMNCAVVFLVFVLLCAAVFWYLGERKYYTGPVVEAEVQGIDPGIGSSNADPEEKRVQTTHDVPKSL
jgi:hypothetical protein